MKTPKIIDIRVIAPAEHAEIVGELVALAISNTPNKIFELLEQSRPYPCYSPNERSSRVYLKFKVRD